MRWIIVGILAAAAATDSMAGGHGYLPAHARVMDEAAIWSAHGKRRLVLWVADAQESREEDYGDVLTCPEMAIGRHYVTGRARLSLVDERRSRIEDSVLLETSPEEPLLGIPVAVGRTLYDAPGGAHRVMRLRDINRDGRADEFVLYMAGSCSDFVATIAGYSKRQDKVIWYTFHLDVNDEGQLSTEDSHWIPIQFLRRAPRRGVWRFTATYPEYPPREYRYEIRYDAAQERFVGAETIVQVP
ncbi:MAG: hypothetical protein FWG56_12170 [Desulfovibrionaceae bacterium]|nr:hypothetical protein [Desulfovibrionaceae bacterium]